MHTQTHTHIHIHMSVCARPGLCIGAHSMALSGHNQALNKQRNFLRVPYRIRGYMPPVGQIFCRVSVLTRVWLSLPLYTSFYPNPIM